MWFALSKHRKKRRDWLVEIIEQARATPPCFVAARLLVAISESLNHDSGRSGNDRLSKKIRATADRAAPGLSRLVRNQVRRRKPLHEYGSARKTGGT